MRLRHLALAPALIVLVAACSGGSTATPTTFASAGPEASSAVQTIEVKLTDALRMEPDRMTVKAGQPVRFVVTNIGSTTHEFYLGDEAAQMKHEEEMVSMGDMMQDEPGGVVLNPGETKELTFTFPTAGASSAGCHQSGHYGAGMQAAITVTE